MPFYQAEAYHQNFAVLHPDYPYIAIIDAPKVAALAQLFPTYYRATPSQVRVASANSEPVMTGTQIINPLPARSHSDGRARRVIHPWPLRVMHWLNAVAIVTLIGTGWQIYNASPFLPFIFPHWATIGEWLGAAIAWHLAAIWLLMLNGLAYLTWGLATGHFRRKFWPVSPRSVLRDVWAAVRFRLPHEVGFITPCSARSISA